MHAAAAAAAGDGPTPTPTAGSEPERVSRVAGINN